MPRSPGLADCCLFVLLDSIEMVPCVLLALPEALVRLILVEWLHLKYVLRLDSAFCSRQRRTNFLSLAYAAFTTLSIRSYNRKETAESILKWTATRGAQLDGMFVMEYVPYNAGLLPPFLAVTGPALRWVSCCSVVGDVTSSTKCQQMLIEVAKGSPNITKLEVQGGQWDHQLGTVTKAFHKLIYLSMTFVYITTDNLATALSQCKCLEKLILDVACEIPVEVAVPTLKTIYIHRPRCMADAVLIAVGQHCAKLETLLVFDPSLLDGVALMTDVGMRAVLQGCPLLRVTDIEDARGFSNELRAEVAGRCNLKVLRAWDWNQINDELTRAILKVCPNLIVLDCRNCEWLTDATLAVCARHCPLLEVCILTGCQLVTNGAVEALVVTHGARLRELHFGGCTQLGDAVIFATAQHCPLLRTVSLPQGTSDAAVVKLAEGCPLLRHLDARYTAVSDAGQAALATHCPKLENVCLMSCREFTAEIVRALVKSCAHLAKVTLPTHLADQLRDLPMKSLSVQFRNW
jgi:hypothetical protein